MALLSGDGKPSFKIPKDLAREISEEFGFTLTKKELAKLEIASGETIRWRHLITDGSKRACDDQSLGRSVIRHKKIAELANRLAKELQADEVEGGSWCLRCKNNRFRGHFHSTFNVLRKPIDRYDEVGPMLLVLHKLASQPEPEPPALRTAKRGRPQKVDTQGWDFLLVELSAIFRGRRKPPTSNYKKRRYTSRFLQGFLKLHDALPVGVRAHPANALGSYIHNWIKSSNKRRRAHQADKNQSA